MFHGSTLGKIITLVNVVDEKRPSGCTRKKATYTICTGKDGYGKNSHFCNIDYAKMLVFMLFFCVSTMTLFFVLVLKFFKIFF